MERESLKSIKNCLRTILADQSISPQSRASKVVNYLLKNSLDEELPEIFALCADLELPPGISQYNAESYLTAWQKLLDLCQ